MGQPDIHKWIHLAREGDEKALDELCRHYRPMVTDYVSRHLGANARRWCCSEDIVQQDLMETFVDRDWKDGDSDSVILRQLKQRAQWRILDVVRHHHRDGGESAVGESNGKINADERTGEVTMADTQRWLRGLIAKLPEKYSCVLELCALEGLSFTEASERLGIPIETVRKRYDRARRKLVERTSPKANES